MIARSHPARHFGRRAVPLSDAATLPVPSAWAGDLRLFAVSFLGGLLFMSVYLA